MLHPASKGVLVIGVFGANGFIGQHVTKRLVGAGHDVLAVARGFDDEMKTSAAKLYEGDLRDSVAMDRALAGLDTVVQLMGTSTPAQGNARSTEHIDNDVIPHVDFLNRCVAAGIKRFIFASSGGTIYGPTPRHVLVGESAPTNPISSHGVTKLMVEHFIKLHGHLDGLEYVILRLANPYGPGQVLKRGQGLIPALMGRYRAGLPVTVFGDGSSARDYIYIDDVTRAVEMAVEAKPHLSLVLNVGSGRHRTILEVIRTIERVAGITFEVAYAPAREADVPSIALNVQRISDEFGWKPEVSFEEGLADTLTRLRPFVDV